MLLATEAYRPELAMRGYRYMQLLRLIVVPVGFCCRRRTISKQVHDKRTPFAGLSRLDGLRDGQVDVDVVGRPGSDDAVDIDHFYQKKSSGGTTRYNIYRSMPDAHE